MDIGEDVKRNSVAVQKLAATVPELMQGWTKDNFKNYQETMELIREGAPVQWVRLYLDAVKMGLEKNTNINININRQQDRDQLQAMVRARIPAVPKGEYVPFEEVKPQSLPAREKGDNDYETATTDIR